MNAKVKNAIAPVINKSTHPGPRIIGSWCLGVATVLIMAFLNPASAQATPMPEIGVFDYGSYSGQDTNSEDRESYKHQGVMDYMTQEQGFDNSRRSTIETHEMTHVNRTGMVFKNCTYGTILVPIDEILASSPKMMESLYQGDALILKFMMKADVPGIYIYMLEGQQEPLFVKEKDAGLKSLSKNNTLAAYVTPVPIHNILTPSNTLSPEKSYTCCKEYP